MLHNNGVMLLFCNTIAKILMRIVFRLVVLVSLQAVVCVSLQAQFACTGVLVGTLPAGAAQATVTLQSTSQSTNQTTTANSVDGRFVLGGICPGQFKLHIEHSTAAGNVGHDTLVTIGNDTLRITLEHDAQLEAVEVLGEKHAADAPTQTVATLRGAQLQQTRGLSLGESLKGITGVYTLQSGPSISKPIIRGLTGNRVLILNNGVRQEGQQWGSEHAPEIDPFVATRLSVVKGATAVRYGPDALSGVILIDPATLPTHPGLGGELNLVGQSNGQAGIVSGIFEGALGGRLRGLSLRAQGTAKRAGNARAPGYYLDNTAYREDNFSVAAGYQRGGISTSAYYSQFATQLGILGASAIGSVQDLQAAIARGEPLIQPGFTYAINRPYQTVLHQLAKLHADWDLNDGGLLEATYAFQSNQRAEYDFLPLNRSEAPELFLRLESHTADALWHHPALRIGRQSLAGTVGASFVTQGNEREYQFLIPNFRLYNTGVFVTEKWAAGTWLVDLGLRYDYRSQQAFFSLTNNAPLQTPLNTWQGLSAAAGARKQWTEHLYTSLNASTAWRGPNVSELYSSGVHQAAAAFELGNSALRPERGYNLSAALDYTHGRWAVAAELFSNYYDGFIFVQPRTVPVLTLRGAFPAFDYAQANVLLQGAEATVRFEVVRGLTLETRNSLLRAWNYTINDYLVLMPAPRTENTVRYEQPKWGRLREPYLEVGALSLAQQNWVPAGYDFAPPPAAYTLLNLEAGTAFGFGKKGVAQKVFVSVSARNLLDARYRDYLNRFRYFTDEAGRNIILRLRVLLNYYKSQP